MNRRADPDRLGAAGLIGASVPRLAAKRLVAGQGRYADDLRFARPVHAAFLRSPHAHARIDRIDLAPALANPGVVAVLDGRDIAAVCRPWTTRLATFAHHRSAAQPALAIDRALWQGQPVAMVLAESRAIAEDAVGRIVVDWTELTPVVDPVRAMAPDAPLIHPELGTNIAIDHHLPEVGAPPADAIRIARRLKFTRHTGVSLEGRAIVAEFDRTSRRLTLHHSHQAPHQMRAVFAECLDLAEADVRIVTPDVGGGFGIKLHAYDDELAVAAAAMLVGRTVKFVADRLEGFVSDIHARGHDVDCAIHVTKDGTIIGFEVDSVAGIGAYSVYPRSSVLEGMHVIGHVGAPYRTTMHRGRLRAVYQNKVGTASYRGVGQPIACGITEQLVDAAAATLAIDPAEIRRRNFHRGAQAIGGVPAGELSHAACFERLLELIDYPALRREQASARAAGRHVGIGFAAFIEMNSPGSGIYGEARVKIAASDGCTLKLEPSGTLTCITSTGDQGQGSETGIRQLIAATLDVPLEHVRIVMGDTAVTPQGGGTFASRGLTIGGEVALAAAESLRDHLLDIAAAQFKRDRDRLVLAGGVIRDAEEALVTLAELAAIMHFRPHTLPAGVAPQPAVTLHESPKRPFQVANGVQASLVEVDADTGIVTLRKHWVVEDCGRVVNPLLADEQLRGGVIQGIGAALFEECRYDENGQLLTGTLVDYLVPMASEMPDIEIDHIETPVAGTRLGGKGVGEAGVIGAAAAVTNAINDALGPFAVTLTEQPYTPERILRALRKA